MAGTKRLLFVCVENSCRSQMAEAFAHMYGMGKIEAFSAGSQPSGKVHPQAVESMREVGYDLSSHQSKSLAGIPDVQYDVAITMGCGDACPIVRSRRREEWSIPDPKGLSPEKFREVRDLIRKQVQALIAQAVSGT